jgi:hypothetical protein
MLIYDAAITGSFSYDGVDISAITSSEASVNALNQFTSSYNTGSFTGSFRGNGSGLNGVVSASFASNATSASQAQNAVSSSFASNANLLDSKDSTEFATTGSNIFTGIQYNTNNVNPNGFGASASIYTDGGVRITRDAYVSGTIYVNNLSVFGTQSINYITSSQLNISTNIISVNTDTPFIRFGGLSVYDSGSTGLTGSILWDSERDHWIYSNPSGSTYNSAMIMSGPRNSGSLGTEQGTINNVIIKGQGGDHITSSQIIDDGTTVRIPGNLQVTGSLSGSSATFNTSITTDNLLTIAYADISTGNNRGLRIVNTDVNDGTAYNITSGRTGVNNGDFVIRNTTTGVNNLVFDRSTGAATFSSALTGSSAMFLNNVSISNGSISNDSGDRSLIIYGSLGSANSDVAALQLIQIWNGRAFRSIVSAQQDIAGGNASSALVFKTSFFNGTDVTTSERMRITSAGNVGIGTTAPNSTANYSTLSINGTSGGQITWQTGGNLVGYAYNTSTSVVLGANTGNFLAFDAGSSEKMRITSGGNVGIGTSSPSQKLEVAGVIRGEAVNVYGSTDPASTSPYLFSPSLGALGFGANGSERMRITSGGNVLIGTTSNGGQLLQVNGNLSINNTLSSPGNLIETAGLNLYLRPASGYKVFVDTGDGLDVTSGVTRLSTLRTSTLFSEYTNNLSGAYNAGTFYSIVNSSQMASGIYILRAYVDTYAIGGGTYFITYTSVPFYFYTGGTNNNGTQTFPTMLGSGHAGYNPPIIRLRLSFGVEGGLTYLEFDPNANWSNVNGTSGATVTFTIKRIGD